MKRKSIRDITPDTERALEAIKPLAEVLRIDVKADGKRLYCNGQAIGICSNSTWATCMEFLGYAFLKVYMKDRFYTSTKLPAAIVERIKDYWISEKRMKQILLEEQEYLNE